MHHKKFFMIPNRIVDLELKPRDFTVYCCLFRHSDSKVTLRLFSGAGIQKKKRQVKTTGRRKNDEQIFHDFRTHRRIPVKTERDHAVYCCLVKHSNKNGVCFPSRRLIAEECCIDKKTVDAALRSLEKIGLVKKQKRKRQDGSNTSNLYTVELFR